ncbi:hypothetical protein ABT168_01465 [Streptomyces sp. NPDC001793]
MLRAIPDPARMRAVRDDLRQIADLALAHPTIATASPAPPS